MTNRNVYEVSLMSDMDFADYDDSPPEFHVFGKDYADAKKNAKRYMKHNFNAIEGVGYSFDHIRKIPTPKKVKSGAILPHPHTYKMAYDDAARNTV